MGWYAAKHVIGHGLGVSNKVASLTTQKHFSQSHVRATFHHLIVVIHYARQSEADIITYKNTAVYLFTDITNYWWLMSGTTFNADCFTEWTPIPYAVPCG